MARKHKNPAYRPLPHALTRLLDDPLIFFPDVTSPGKPSDDAEYFALLEQADARVEHFQRSPGYHCRASRWEGSGLQSTTPPVSPALNRQPNIYQLPTLDDRRKSVRLQRLIRSANQRAFEFPKPCSFGIRCFHTRPGSPRPRSSVHVTRWGPTRPMTARPRIDSSPGFHGASVKVSSRRMTASLPDGVETARS